VELWAKAEFLNPTGSVKDRAALSIVEHALVSGALDPTRTLIDASSGNTAVAYAMLGAQLGFSVEICVPRNVNSDRVNRIRALGGEIILTDPSEGTDGAQQEARRRSEANPGKYYYADQYNNPLNPLAHYRTTGPEIWSQTSGRITHFIAGVGTGGTISGTARYLKERGPKVRVVGVQPDLPLHGIEGLKHLATALRPGTYDGRVVDDTALVETESAQEMSRTLAREEGLTVGISSGAAVLAASRVGHQIRAGVLVTLLPDRGESRPGRSE
jgi:cysteine synthase B